MQLVMLEQDTPSHVICVRGGQTPVPNRWLYAAPGDVDVPYGITADLRTNLDWERCPYRQNGFQCEWEAAAGRTWQFALEYCDDVGTFPHDDWRLPNRVELASIVDASERNPATNFGAFPATEPGRFWSSTSDPRAPDTAWVVDFALGGSELLRKDHEAFVRCVRSRP